MISIIAAMGNERVIGIENRLPWQLPADMQWFRKCTLGKPIIMGRTTFESIGKPLPGRKNIVVSRNQKYRAKGVTVVHSLEAAIASASGAEEVMIIGGANIYKQALSLAERLYITHIHADFDGDSWFPDYAAGQWQVVSREQHGADEKNGYEYDFTVLKRA
ncbi:MAG: type 3 dihydrofolate reductase [Gammaproteobacteria bacterium]|nr:type 3 dihydrofolate reductase [Gammaproteobacteria bacterium]MCF6231297.1 type 3 dihydrofolate reductase [Gammaproteobacteria bacterium]